MSPEQRDSLYLSAPDDDIENVQAYKTTKQSYESEYNKNLSNLFL